MKNRYTKDTIIEAIQRFYDKNGKIPRRVDYKNNPEYPGYMTVVTYFGSWNKAIEAAGFAPNSQPCYTSEEIISAIQQFHVKYSRIPLSKDFSNNSNFPDATTVCRHFGSWNKAIEAAGFTADKPRRTKDEFIEAIHRFYEKNDRIPQSRDFINNNKYPSSTTVQKYFGSWNNAIETAGFTPNIQNGFGINTLGLDGHLYRSQAEAYLADNYLHGKYTYDIEPQYPKPYGLYYDWYIKELDVYIELDGGLRPERVKYKTQINRRLGRNCLVIPVATIYRKDFSLEKLLQIDRECTKEFGESRNKVSV